MPHKLTFEEYCRAVIAANSRMKEKNGHSFIHILKTRCQYCGRSPRQKGRCSGWFQTFVALLAGELTGTIGIPDEPKEVA
jgi:hypothetical protein